MIFCAKNLETEFREKYTDRLKTVKGSLVVLRKLLFDERKRKKPVLKNGEEDKNCIYLSNNFNCLYEGVLEFVVEEERRNGSSIYRSMLDRVDIRLDELTSLERIEATELEKERVRESIPRHDSQKYYVKPVYSLPIIITDTMRVG